MIVFKNQKWYYFQVENVIASHMNNLVSLALLHLGICNLISDFRNKINQNSIRSRHQAAV